jgi:hypothetical protein
MFVHPQKKTRQSRSVDCEQIRVSGGQPLSALKGAKISG